MLIIGVLGIVLSLASVVLLGADITTFINNGFHNFKFTKIFDVMHKLTPTLWGDVFNYLNGDGVSFQKTAAEIAVNLPACIVGVVIGAAFVLIGFRVRPYEKT